jgi:hypothetical protein
MGKGFIYVLLALIAIAVVASIVWGIMLLGIRLMQTRREARYAHLLRTTGWESYCDVAKSGAITIGVQRSAVIAGEVRVFEGPLKMFDLPADHDPVDVQVKWNVARDRASLYNALRDELHE